MSEEKQALRASAGSSSVNRLKSDKGDDHEHNVKFTNKEGDAGDKLVKEGPLKDRGCTDVFCCIIFVVHWVGFVSISGVALAGGSPKKLYVPRDYKGDYCGVSDNWNSGNDYSDYTKMISFMNLTEVLDQPAKEFICSSAAEAELTSRLSLDDYDDYMCACCKSPCDKCSGVYTDLTDYSSSQTAELASLTSSRLTDLTTASSSSVSSLYSYTGPNAGEYNSVWSDATRWFYQVCVADCADATYNGSDMRTYTYLPAPDSDYKTAWETLKNDATVSADLRNVLLNSFTFTALPYSHCPYQEKYCIPMPGLDL
jgi:hypothetical protein